MAEAVISGSVNTRFNQPLLISQTFLGSVRCFNNSSAGITGTSIVAGKTGVEPVTQGLTDLRSAAELLSRNNGPNRI